MISGDVLENAGQYCYPYCYYNGQGKCDWCGTEGYCCMKNYPEGGCDGSFGGETRHECVLPPKGMYCSLWKKLPTN